MYILLDFDRDFVRLRFRDDTTDLNFDPSAIID